MSDPRSGLPGSPESAASAPERTGAAGAILLKERRRQSLSLGDISRQLKLSVRQVEALERDDYSGYQGPVFIHGFIRNYAKLLGLDPEPLIRATDLMLNPPAAAAEFPREVVSSQPSRAKKRRVLWPTIAVALFVVVGLSVYFGGRRAPSNTPSVAAGNVPAPTAKTTIEAKAGAAKAKIESKASVDAAAKSAAKPVTGTEAKTATKDETAEDRPSPEAGAAVAAESVARLTVRMIFEQESWVEIKDRTGNTIFGQLNPAGSRRSVSGEPPLSVVVGNAAGVRLFQGDKSVDLAPHTRVDVARLTLE